ncbi:hypothetical protein HK102_011841 [Quaeritorhiza haematococci]|nr:hypothetical protein HK102_011841 [Quaeritorhiza haematococci]
MATILSIPSGTPTGVESSDTDIQSTNLIDDEPHLHSLTELHHTPTIHSAAISFESLPSEEPFTRRQNSPQIILPALVTQLKAAAFSSSREDEWNWDDIELPEEGLVAIKQDDEESEDDEVMDLDERDRESDGDEGQDFDWTNKLEGDSDDGMEFGTEADLGNRIGHHDSGSPVHTAAQVHADSPTPEAAIVPDEAETNDLEIHDSSPHVPEGPVPPHEPHSTHSSPSHMILRVRFAPEPVEVFELSPPPSASFTSAEKLGESSQKNEDEGEEDWDAGLDIDGDVIKPKPLIFPEDSNIPKPTASSESSPNIGPGATSGVTGLSIIDPLPDLTAGSVAPLAPPESWQVQVNNWLVNNQISSATPRCSTPLVVKYSRSPTKSQPQIESLDDDFDLPTGMDLKLAPAPMQRPPSSATASNNNTDVEMDDWSDSFGSIHDTLPHGGSLSMKRYLSSPTPSSNASMIASESEDEGFDDIEFPDFIDARSFSTRRQSVLQDFLEEDEQDDMSSHLVITSDDCFDPAKLTLASTNKNKHDVVSSSNITTNNKKPPLYASLNGPNSKPKSQRKRSFSPSKIPRPNSASKGTHPTPPSSAQRGGIASSSSSLSNATGGARPISAGNNKTASKVTTSTRTTPAKIGPRSTNRSVSVSSPSASHLQRLSTQLIKGRTTSVSKDPSHSTGSGPGTTSFGHSKVFRKPKTAQEYGDGTELDMFDDLPVSVTQENKFKIATPTRNMSYSSSFAPSSSASMSGGGSGGGVGVIGNRRGFIPPNPPLIHRSGAENVIMRGSPERDKRSALLNIGPFQPRPEVNALRRSQPSSHPSHHKKNSAKVVGDMVYNPALQKWEGNEDILKEFDKATDPSLRSSTRPALITNKGGSKVPQVVGSMVFDPVKMCWIGNEEEEDVFAGFEIETDKAETEGGVGGSKGAPTVAVEFNLPRSKKEAMYIAESSHKLFIGRWYPKVVNDSRSVILAHS